MLGLSGDDKVARMEPKRKGPARDRRPISNDLPAPAALREASSRVCARRQEFPEGRRSPPPPPAAGQAEGTSAARGGRWMLLLQLAFQRFHFFRQRRVLGDQRLDLANGMQHGG